LFLFLNCCRDLFPRLTHCLTDIYSRRGCVLLRLARSKPLVQRYALTHFPLRIINQRLEHEPLYQLFFHIAHLFRGLLQIAVELIIIMILQVDDVGPVLGMRVAREQFNDQLEDLANRLHQLVLDIDLVIDLAGMFSDLVNMLDPITLQIVDPRFLVNLNINIRDTLIGCRFIAWVPLRHPHC